MTNHDDHPLPDDFQYDGTAGKQPGPIISLGPLPSLVGTISLRDWFAGMAMQGTIPIDDIGATNTAIRAYKLADAMLKAREDKP